MGSPFKARFTALHLALAVVATTAVLMLYFRHVREQAITKLVLGPSPMPAVTLVQPDEAQATSTADGKYELSNDWFSANIPVWEQALAELAGKPDIAYLEIGVFEGRSFVWMLDNILTHPSARATAVDVFSGSYKEVFQRNVRQSGSSDKVTTLVGSSQLLLRELPLDGFDVIYIDGSHAASDVLEDAVLSWRLLRAGGVIIFDDYLWVGFDRWTPDPESPKRAIDAFYRFFGEHFDVLHNAKQIIMKKKAKAASQSAPSDHSGHTDWRNDDPTQRLGPAFGRNRMGRWPCG